ncbi:MAG: hypothetical protein HGB32_14535 [Geobacteraceae bacterium]|nr:hypothetical protein [Geobacteraceae bacterium]NTW81342.1 hypothetical protein [Geobacteraceae bacterium]
MLRNFLSIIVLILFLSACATPHKMLDGSPAYSPHQYNSADLMINWKSERLDKAIVIEGTATNTRDTYAYEALEFEITLLDINGKSIAKQLYNFTPIRFKGPESFKIAIPLENNMQIDKVKFNYRYGIDDTKISVSFVSAP